EPPASLRRTLMATARGDATQAERRDSWWRRVFPEPARVAWGLASVATLLCAVSVGWAFNLQAQLGSPPNAPALAAATSPDYAAAGPGFALDRAQMHRLVGSDA